MECKRPFTTVYHDLLHHVTLLSLITSTFTYVKDGPAAIVRRATYSTPCNCDKSVQYITLFVICL